MYHQYSGDFWGKPYPKMSIKWEKCDFRIITCHFFHLDLEIKP
jgi:hypothetical protein